MSNKPLLQKNIAKHDMLHLTFFLHFIQSKGIKRINHRRRSRGGGGGGGAVVPPNETLGARPPFLRRKQR